MAGLVPAIHGFVGVQKEVVDARTGAGCDERGGVRATTLVVVKARRLASQNT
jgi:hypothetical protein